MKEFIQGIWNDFLFYLLWVAGGILGLLFMIMVMVSLWRFYSRQGRDGQSRILGTLLLFVSFFVLISMLSSESLLLSVVCWTGIVGNWASRYLLTIFGFGAFLIPLLGFAWGWNRLRNTDTEEIFLQTTFSLIALLGFLCALSFFSSEYTPGGFYPAGVVGKGGGEFMNRFLGRIGSCFILFALTAVGVVLSIGLDRVKRVGARLPPMFGALAAWVRKSLFTRRRAPTVNRGGRSRKKFVPPGKEVEPLSSLPEIPVASRGGEETPTVSSPDAGQIRERTAVPVKRRTASGSGKEVHYRYPPLTLLNDPTESTNMEPEESLRGKARILERKLMDFGVRARVVNISPGPVITRFELEPAPGVKVNRIVSLSDDLALALQSTRIRILAPIPGKGTIGVEVPNPTPSMVCLKELLRSNTYRTHEAQLKFALGKGISGRLEYSDLTRMPHLLIAGATGSGKSVCMNTIVVSLLYHYGPSEVQFLMVDPKMLELTLYERIPHLLSPVVTEAKEVAVALRWATEEMEGRYRQLASLGVRGIDTFNRRVKEMKEIGEFALDDMELNTLPYIVIIIDELADLMLTVANEIEEPIARLAQMARAVGIHLVLATQRPSVNVITGVIKANFPSRIAFQVATKIDSRTIIDMNGAEKLLGMGDMLFLPAGSAEPTRIHGCYISDAEIKRIVSYVRSQDIASRKLDFTSEESHVSIRRKDRDPLFNEALNLIVRHQQGSISLLQRRLKVGYARAARLVDELEDAGIVGPFDGSKAREVLVDESYLDDLPGSGAEGDEGNPGRADIRPGV